MSKIKDSAPLSRRHEDYLRMILELEDALGKVRVVDLAKAAEVSAPSISEAVKVMSDRGYVDHAVYGKVHLTAEGREHAERIRGRYEVLYRFFKDILGLDDHQAREQACLAEHAVKDAAVTELSTFVQRIENCEKAADVDCDCCMSASLCRDRHEAAQT